MDGLIGIWGLAASLILVVIAVAVSALRRLDLAGTIAWASTRAALQLLVVGLVLVPVLADDAPLALSFLWVALMVVVAAETVRSRAPTIPGLRWIAVASVGGSLAVGLAIVFGLGILPLEPVAFVPIAGILAGNTLPSTVLALRRIVDELDGSRGEIEQMLALGFDAAGAQRRPVRTAARDALLPQIERTKVVGLVALPGAMTGLLLAGVDPIEAVAVQLAVMYLILGGVAVSVLLVVILVARKAFTTDQRFEPLVPPEIVAPRS